MDMGSNFDRKGFGLDLERARLAGFGYVCKGEFGGSDENLVVCGGQRLRKGPPMKYSESA